MAHLEIEVKFTDNGTLVLAYPNEELDGVRLPPAEALLSYNTSRSEALKWAKKFELSTTLDHTIILDPIFTPFLKRHKLTKQDLISKQRVKDEEGWYIDEFGLYVYSYSTFSLVKQFKDMRYD